MDLTTSITTNFLKSRESSENLTTNNCYHPRVSRATIPVFTTIPPAIQQLEAVLTFTTSHQSPLMAELSFVWISDNFRSHLNSKNQRKGLMT